MAWAFIIFLMGIGVWDIWRIFKGQITISKIIQGWCPKWLDAMILITGIILFWWLMGGEVVFAKAMLLVLLIHFFWPA